MFQLMLITTNDSLYPYRSDEYSEDNTCSRERHGKESFLWQPLYTCLDCVDRSREVENDATTYTNNLFCRCCAYTCHRGHQIRYRGFHKYSRCNCRARDHSKRHKAVEDSYYPKKGEQIDLFLNEEERKRCVGDGLDVVDGGWADAVVVGHDCDGTLKLYVYAMPPSHRRIDGVTPTPSRIRRKEPVPSLGA